jgi:Spy/CpxP family protein refolding chaperone
MSPLRPAACAILGLLLLGGRPAPAVAQDHGSHDHTSPYVDLQGRDIKALSPEEVENLLAGEGMGFALPAELNGYPGPRHVLDMAPMLGLTSDQRAAIQQIFDDMQATARELGAKVVDGERELDRAFAAGTITPEELGRRLEGLARNRSALRQAHLEAHLRLRPILTEDQRRAYERARGYGG